MVIDLNSMPMLYGWVIFFRFVFEFDRIDYSDGGPLAGGILMVKYEIRYCGYRFDLYIMCAVRVRIVRCAWAGEQTNERANKHTFTHNYNYISL